MIPVSNGIAMDFGVASTKTTKAPLGCHHTPIIHGHLFLRLLLVVCCVVVFFLNTQKLYLLPLSAVSSSLTLLLVLSHSRDGLLALVCGG